MVPFETRGYTMIEVGRPAPGFTLTDYNRRQVSLSEFDGKKNPAAHGTCYGGAGTEKRPIGIARV